MRKLKQLWKKGSFPDGDEYHDFGHPDWCEATWVFHEIYKRVPTGKRGKKLFAKEGKITLEKRD